MQRLSFCFAILLLAAVAFAAPEEFGLAPTPETPTADEILLKDGNLLVGRIVEQRPDVVVFESDSLGLIEIPWANIERLARAADRSGVMVDPDYNSLMFCPTPATLSKGDAYFRDFELFFLNFGYAPSDRFNLSFGTLFPISGDLVMISIGGKLMLLDRTEQPVGLALVGSYTLLEEVSFGSAGVVAGVGDKRSSLNLSVNRAYDDDGDTETIFLLGADTQLTKRSKVFAEYLSSSSILDDDDFNGFINLGVRLFGESHSLSLSGFRPLDTDSGSLIAWPMLAYSNHF